LLIVATDRLSAFDVVLPTPQPGKGRLLTQTSAKWFEWEAKQADAPAHHLISTDVNDLPENVDNRDELEGRIMIGAKTRVIPIECVARGYLVGSGWKDYKATGAVCGIKLPANLRQCDQLAEPIFTPATKASVGHDENISFDRAVASVGPAVMEQLRQWTLHLYRKAAAMALTRGIIIADTKLEFGLALGPDGQPTDEILLIDEIFTPDSSRFWPADQYEPGRDQVSFDKQFVREFLEREISAGRWDRNPPGPKLPDEIVSQTIAKYEEALHRLFP
jgi:phosphoribosylaminoimidazole-succinocarboxamide synthase